MGRCMMLRKGETHTTPRVGTPLSEIAVGSSIYLNENGSPAEYLVVHQGLPLSSYDASCDGTWLLRKDCYSYNRQWSTSEAYTKYEQSYIHKYLNSTCLEQFDSDMQALIKTATVPSGADGATAKLFLLNSGELARLSYFSGKDESSRIAYRNGTASFWWLRTHNSNYNYCILSVQPDGAIAEMGTQTDSRGIRPALILPYNALLQDDGTIKI